MDIITVKLKSNLSHFISVTRPVRMQEMRALKERKLAEEQELRQDELMAQQREAETLR